MKAKKLLSLLCSAVLAFGAVALPIGGKPLIDTQIEADAFITSGDWSYGEVYDNGKKCAIISRYMGDSSATHVTVPYMIDGLKVTRLSGQVFYYNSKITEVTLPSSVKIIYPTAFRGMPNLEKIGLNNNPNFEFTGGVLYARDRDKNNQDDEDDTDSVMRGYYNGNEVKKSVIYCASKSKQIEIPNGVTTIEDTAFESCENLEHVILPNTITAIGEYAFYRCTSLQDITIPYGTNYIGDYAFSECKALRKVDFPSTLEYIGSYAFRACFSLKHVHIPDGVDYIAPNAFSGQYEEGDLTIYGSEDNEQARESAEDSGCNYVTPTTGEDGTLSFGDFTHDPDDPFDHSYVLTATVPPTCTTPGGLAGICFCGYRYFQQIPPTGHAYVLQSVDADGTAHYKCSVCGEEKIVKTGVVMVISDKIGKDQAHNYSGLDITVFDSEGQVAKDADVNGTSKAAVESLEDGKYLALVSMAGFVPRTVEFSVTDGQAEEVDAELHRTGDITGDGNLNAADLLRAKSHIKGINSLEDYDYDCANVDENDKLNAADLLQMKAHVKGVNKLW